MLRAHAEFSSERGADPGLLFLLLTNLVRLTPGQALFIPPRTVHAYLQGSGLEVMASSDNVLRCGLTSKHVEPLELMRVVRFESQTPEIILPTVEDERDAVYVAPTPLYEVHMHRTGRPLEITAETHEIVLVLSSSSEVEVGSDGGDPLRLGAGQVAFLPEGGRYEISGPPDASVVRVNRPLRAASFRGRTPTALGFGTSGLRGLVSDISDLEAYVNARGFLEWVLARGLSEPGDAVARRTRQSPEQRAHLSIGLFRSSRRRLLAARLRHPAFASFDGVCGGAPHRECHGDREPHPVRSKRHQVQQTSRRGPEG
ncbi:MAG: hypothetical protein HC923_09140 [Myxococcales bacterium]|nr:hypothetical protein [Myxococcales bacterium]